MFAFFVYCYYILYLSQTSLFWQWILTAILESTILSVLPLFILANYDYDTGTQNTFYEAGATCFTAIVLVVNLKMLFIQSKWPMFASAMMALTIFFYFASIFFITSFTDLDFNFYHVSFQPTKSAFSPLFKIFISFSNHRHCDYLFNFNKFLP